MVAIITILVAMLLPALSKATEKARQVVCLNNVKQIALGVMMYASDYKGYAPYFRSWGIKKPVDAAWYSNLCYLSYSTHVYDFLWKRLLPTYVSSLETLRCPSRVRFHRVFCYLTKYYKQEVKNSAGDTCAVCSSYYVKPFRWEDFTALGNAHSETAHIPYRVGDRPNRVLVWDGTCNLPEDEAHGAGQCGCLAHPYGVTVGYEHSSAEFIFIAMPLEIQIYRPCPVSSTTQFMHIMRRDNLERPYRY